MRILVAEDQHTLARNIQKYLQMEERYTVDVVFNGGDAIEKALHSAYDCIVMDIMMPGIDGFTACRQLRDAGCCTPILMLTSLSGAKHTIQGLDAGADDYLTKPFNMDILCARIRALLRRTDVERAPILKSGEIEVDPAKKRASLKGKPVNLAPKEYALLEYLLRNAGVVQSRERIIEHVWGESEAVMFSQTLDVHIAYLRKKLGKHVIETVPGSGYLIPEDSC